MQIFGRDIYVLAGASLVNPTTETDPEEQLYDVAGLSLETAAGDPLTWGEWFEATATSRTMTIGGPDGPRTDVRLSLHNLVPGGLYSVFWGTLGPDSVHPLCPDVERTLPLDAYKRANALDPNAFVADATGAAEFHVESTGLCSPRRRSSTASRIRPTARPGTPSPTWGSTSPMTTEPDAAAASVTTLCATS